MNCKTILITRQSYIYNVMDKATFLQHLQTASGMVAAFTREHCYNDLPPEYLYIITPNSRTVEPEDEHLTETEITVLQEWNRQENQHLTAGQVVDLLWQDGKVPVWIDMTITEATAGQTIMDLYCSRRLRDDKDLMHGPVAPPFHIQVTLPPDYQKGVLFDVNWKKYWFLQNQQKASFTVSHIQLTDGLLSKNNILFSASSRNGLFY
jgi:hypothetical protein